MLQIFNYNAGKGDCIRIRYTGISGTPHNILIDSGVIRFGLEFESICQGILGEHEKIDVMIISHVDTDHLGGMLYNLRNRTKLCVNEVWMNHGRLMGKNTDLSIRQNDELYTKLKEQNIPVKAATTGMTYELDGAVFRILWPDEETLHQLYEGATRKVWITLNFGKKKFKETITFAEELLQKKDLDENLRIIAEVYASICKAYTENVPAEEMIGKFLDEKECLIVKIEDGETEALVYQMLGYVYGEYYKQYVKAVRCLNRAYRMGQDYAVLESLGCAYYFLAMKDALREDDTVDVEKVDRVSLYKARECFLILLDKADELYLASMMKREGGVIYNTFWFEQDNYRVLTLYPILMKNLPDEDAKMRRDFEMKYAGTVCQSGTVNLAQFSALTEEDKILISILAEENRMLMSDV